MNRRTKKVEAHIIEASEKEKWEDISYKDLEAILELDLVRSADYTYTRE